MKLGSMHLQIHDLLVHSSPQLQPIFPQQQYSTAGIVTTSSLPAHGCARVAVVFAEKVLEVQKNE